MTLFPTQTSGAEGPCEPPAIRLNIEEARTFLSLLSPSEQGKRVFTAIGLNKDIKNLHGSFEALADELMTLNNKGYSIFTHVNELEGQRRIAANITSVNAVFVDLDGAPLAPVLELTDVAPHMIIESSPNRWHAYWCVYDCELDHFKNLQHAIATKFDGDPAVCDLPRLMRIPGFIHHKSSNMAPFVTRIHTINDTPHYSVNDVMTGLQLNAPNTRPTNATKFNPSDIVEEGNRHISLTRYAGSLIAQGYDSERALTLLYQWNNAKCSPPLDDEELETTYFSILTADNGKKASTPPLVEQFNSEYAVVRMEGKTRVITVRDDLEYMTFQDFKAYHANMPKHEGQTATQFWLTHPERRTYKGVVFKPGANTEPDHFNLWSGLRLQPVIGDCSLYLELLKRVVCGNNQEFFDYLINFMAHAVQKPREIPGVAIVLMGGRGAGKGVSISNFGALFGRHYSHLTSAESFLGQFNSHLADKIILFADEVYWSGDKRSEGKLKTLITEPTKQVEAKGLPIVEYDNYTRLFMATNDDWAVPAGADERRFFVLKVDPVWQQDADRFTAIVNELKNGGREAFLHYLTQIDLNGFNPRQIPLSKALADQKLRSLTPIEKWLYECLYRGYIDHIDVNGNMLMGMGSKEHACWPNFASTEALHDNYLAYCQKMGLRYPEMNSTFITKLSSVIELTSYKPTISRRRTTGKKLPSLDECRKQFEAHIRQPIDWPWT